MAQTKAEKAAKAKARREAKKLEAAKPATKKTASKKRSSSSSGMVEITLGLCYRVGSGKERKTLTPGTKVKVSKDLLLKQPLLDIRNAPPEPRRPAPNVSTSGVVKVEDR